MRVLTELLNTNDFEKFANDIVSHVFNVKIRNFAEGRDDGIDGIDDIVSPTVIVQSKRFQSIMKPSEIERAAKKEIEKIRRTSEKYDFQQFEYVFVTSGSLTPETTRAIRDSAKNLMSSDRNIIDGAQLEVYANDKQFESIFRGVGLTAQNFVNQIVSQRQQKIEMESKFYFDSFDDRYFVKTDVMLKAYDILMNEHVVALRGNPGVGKTTNSKFLGLLFSSQTNGAYFVVERNIEDIQSVIDLFITSYKENIGKNLLIVFDDFLGRNSMDATDNELRNVNRICTLAAYVPNLYVILNSRTQILQTAVISNLEFKNFIDSEIRNIVTVDMSQLSEGEKAAILRRNLELSFDNETSEGKEELSDMYDDLRTDGRYRNIIRSQKWNPRLIEQISKHWSLGKSKNSFYEYIQETLKTPFLIYEELFGKLSDAEKYFLLEIYFFDTYPIIKERAEKSFYDLKLPTIADVNKIESKLEESWLIFSIDEKTGQYLIDFANPSVIDYLKFKAHALKPIREKIKSTSRYLSQVVREFGTTQLYIDINKQYRDYIDSSEFIGERLHAILSDFFYTERVEEFQKLIYQFSGNFFKNESESIKRIETWVNILQDINLSEGDYRKVFVHELFYGAHALDLLESMMNIRVDQFDELVDELDSILFSEVGEHLNQNEFVDFAEEETGLNVVSVIREEKIKNLQNELDDGTALDDFDSDSFFEKMEQSNELTDVIEQLENSWIEETKTNLNMIVFGDEIDVENDLDFEYFEYEANERAESFLADDTDRNSFHESDSDTVGFDVDRILNRPLENRDSTIL